MLLIVTIGFIFDFLGDVGTHINFKHMSEDSRSEKRKITQFKKINDLEIPKQFAKHNKI